jgi:hypothetical protein
MNNELITQITRIDISSDSFSVHLKKAAAGVEPANHGFANHRLWPLGYAAS